MKRILYFIFLLLILDVQSSTEPLTLDVVLKQTREQAPKVLASLEKVTSAREKVRAAEGAFDANLGLDYDRREGGKYPGEVYKGKIEKPLQAFGAKVFGGYRKSDGTFPVYEGKRVTLDEGEVMAGLSFNLLRNFNIDEKRLKLGLSEFGLEKSEWQNKETLMKLQKEGSLAYWSWVASGHMLKVSQGLLSLAENRQVAFEKRIKRGDLAALYAVENRQYIVKRRTKVRKNQAEFEMAALYLSLYWRNDKGIPQIANFSQLPNLDLMEKTDFNDKKINIKNLMSASFTLQSLNTEVKAIEKQSEFFESRFLPEVAVKYEVARDRGQGSSTLIGTEHKVMVGVNIPIERNLLKGNSAANRAQKRILEHQIRLTQDSLRVKINQLKTKLSAAVDIIQNTKQEVSLGEQLEKGEKKKFRSGASDYFVVNLREQGTFDARLKRIEALFTYQETLAKYRELLMDYKF